MAKWQVTVLNKKTGETKRVVVVEADDVYAAWQSKLLKLKASEHVPETHVVQVTDPVHNADGSGVNHHIDKNAKVQELWSS